MKITSLKYASSVLSEAMILRGGDRGRAVPIDFILYLIEVGERKLLVDAGCVTMPEFEMLPDGKSNPSHVTTTEPYVFTNCYLKHPNCDMRVGTAWKTGTSAWGLMCCYEGILGLQRHYDGLHIQPVFPKHWKTVDATRNFRGNKLNLHYVNKGGSSVALKVDGKPVEGNVVPLFSDLGEHTIEVVLA